MIDKETLDKVRHEVDKHIILESNVSQLTDKTNCLIFSVKPEYAFDAKVSRESLKASLEGVGLGDIPFIVLVGLDHTAVSLCEDDLKVIRRLTGEKQ